MYNWTKKWQGCFIAFPWPQNNNNNNSSSSTSRNKDGVVQKSVEDTYDHETGMEYNCYINQRLDTYWIPKLRQALQERHPNMYPHLE